MKTRSSILSIFIFLLSTIVTYGSSPLSAGWSCDARFHAQLAKQSIANGNVAQAAIFRHVFSPKKNFLKACKLRYIISHSTSDGVIPDLFEGPNDDLRRERTYITKLLTSCSFTATVYDFNESLISFDATPPDSHASYLFSSTAFHSYICRLTPF
ncbi:MAG: hypothetical protein EOP48_26140 [Sphingobacteriales bacterium]|nr:MAG: hypothetical protein EOP48_26140 [Sphingobacteriales bacterium]